jgi:hypothetical protein
MPSSDRKLELKARHWWLRPSHSRLCINRASEFGRLTAGCVGERVKGTFFFWKDLYYSADRYYHSFLLSSATIVNNRIKLRFFSFPPQKCCYDKLTNSALLWLMVWELKTSTQLFIAFLWLISLIQQCTLQIWSSLGDNSHYNMHLDQGTGKGGSQ